MYKLSHFHFGRGNAILGYSPTASTVTKMAFWGILPMFPILKIYGIVLVLKRLIISLTQDNILEILIKQALNNILDAREHLEDLDKIVCFLLEKSYFQFNSDVNKQISETTIGTKFAPLYASHSNLQQDLDTSMTFSLFGLLKVKATLKSS